MYKIIHDTNCTGFFYYDQVKVFFDTKMGASWLYLPSSKSKSQIVSTVSQQGRLVNSAINHGVMNNKASIPLDFLKRKNWQP